MFTIKFKNTNQENGSITKSTIDNAQRHARSIMKSWDSVTVFYTDCPTLTIFESVCGIIVKETK